MYYIAYYLGYFIVMLIAAILAVILANSKAAWVVLVIGSGVQLLAFLGNGATVLEWLIFAAILGGAVWLILRRREAAAAKGREQAQTGWYCPCGRMNSNYVTTCQCGMQKSQIPWRCRCGRQNAGQITICQCGLRKDDVV